MMGKERLPGQDGGLGGFLFCSAGLKAQNGLHLFFCLVIFVKQNRN